VTELEGHRNVGILVAESCWLEMPFVAAVLESQYGSRAFQDAPIVIWSTNGSSCTKNDSAFRPPTPERVAAGRLELNLSCLNPVPDVKSRPSPDVGHRTLAASYSPAARQICLALLRQALRRPASRVRCTAGIKSPNITQAIPNDTSNSTSVEPGRAR